MTSFWRVGTAFLLSFRGWSICRWGFEKGRKSLSVAISGPLVANDLDLVIHAAIDDVGLDEGKAGPHLATGASCECSMSGASHFRDTSSTIQVAGNSPLRFPR